MTAVSSSLLGEGLRGTFAIHAGDHAGYVFRDGAAAVRLARSAGVIAVDIETAGLGVDAWTIKAVSIGTANMAHVLDPALDRDAIRDALRVALVLVVHNSPFDVPLLVGAGLMRQADVAKVNDTVVSARLAAPSEIGGRSLGASCELHLGPGYAAAKRSLEQRCRAGAGLSKAHMFKLLGLDSEAYVQYAGYDIVMTARLHAVLPAAVEARTTNHPFKTSGDSAYLLDREQTVNRILLARACRGVEIDTDVIDEIKVELMSRAAEADELLETYGINTDDTVGREMIKAQAMLALDRVGVLPASYPRRQNGAPSADKRYLERIEHPIVDALTLRSQANRFVDDYADKLLELAKFDNRIHPQVAVAQAVTGRMSYSTPPLQQYPDTVRRMMRFDEPVSSMDWSSIEPVYFANVTGETALIEEFEAGGDLYQPVAEAAGVSRKVAKVILLAQLYGQGPMALALRLDRDEDETRALIERVMGPYEQIRKASRAIRNIGDSHGVVQTMSRRVVPLARDPRTGNTRFFGYRAVNYHVQGSCYDLLAEALYEIHRRGLDDTVYIALHDELVVATTAADEVTQIMRTPPPAFVELAGRIPVLRTERVDLGRHWSPKKET